MPAGIWMPLLPIAIGMASERRAVHGTRGSFEAGTLIQPKHDVHVLHGST